MSSRVRLQRWCWHVLGFRDGLDSGSYTIILSLRDGSPLFTPFLALRARPPSQTTARPKASGLCDIFCGRDVGFAESGYSHASLRDNRSPGNGSVGRGSVRAVARDDESITRLV
jgi:hypothetical protein